MAVINSNQNYKSGGRNLGLGEALASVPKPIDRLTLHKTHTDKGLQGQTNKCLGVPTIYQNASHH